MRPTSVGSRSSGALTARGARETGDLATQVAGLGNRRLAADKVLVAVSVLRQAVAAGGEPMVAQLPKLSESLCLRLRLVLRTPSELPVCKAVLQLAVELMSETELLAQLTLVPLRGLMHELLLRLIDPGLAAFGPEAAQHLLQTLNLLMLKLLQGARRDLALSALLGLLSEHALPRAGRELSELLVKCVRKLSKTLPDMARVLELPLVVGALVEMHAKLTSAVARLAPEAAEAELAHKALAAADETLEAICKARTDELLHLLRQPMHGCRDEAEQGSSTTPHRTPHRSPCMSVRSQAALLRRAEQLLGTDGVRAAEVPLSSSVRKLELGGGCLARFGSAGGWQRQVDGAE